MKIIHWPAVFLFCLAISQTSGAKETSATAKQSSELNRSYHNAQREFHRKNYKEALPLLQGYLDQSRKVGGQKDRPFWVMDQIGMIYLRVLRKPKDAVSFFDRVKDDPRLNDAERDNIASWISAANEWLKLGRFPKSIKKPDELFRLGKRYFDLGNKKLKFPADDGGDAYFHIAATYLVPFVVNYDGHAKNSDALLMMGEIRRRIRTDSAYWSENYYLKEVLRRYPHTPNALKAFQVLKDDIHLGYTGSGGDFTPPSLLRALKHYKKLSIQKPKK